MIEISDTTLREANGEYRAVCQLMQTSGTWMLRSDVFVSTPIIVSKFIVHFWNDGNAVLHDLDRPVRMDLPDDDIRALADWCRINGWQNLKINDRLIADKIGFDYWQRSFRAGIVDNDQFVAYEKSEIERLTNACKKEVEEEKQDAT